MVGLFNLGPFIQLPQPPFYVNPYTWAAHANLLFVDNPAGVGFSYLEREEDLYNNDMSVSQDLYAVFKQFYTYWPELLSNPLYLGGNSYGGAYAPYLAWQMH